MLIPVGFCQINLIFTGAAVPFGAEVTFGVDQPNDSTPSEVAAVVRGLVDDSHVIENLVNDVTVTAVRCKFGPNDTGPFAQIAADIPGTVSSNPSAPMVSALARKETAMGGRAHRGRFYWPGISEGDVEDGGLLATGFKGDFQTTLDTLLSSLDTNDHTMVLLHSEISDPDVVTALNLEARVATQRRRNRR